MENNIKQSIVKKSLQNKSPRQIVMKTLGDLSMKNKELSVAAGITESSLSNFLNGKQKLSDLNLKKIEDILHVSLMQSVNTFSYFLTYYRLQNKLSKAELAKRAGLTAQSFTKYESGEVMPSIKVVKNIGDILNVSIDELTNGPEWKKHENEKLQKRVSLNIQTILKDTFNNLKVDPPIEPKIENEISTRILQRVQEDQDFIFNQDAEFEEYNDHQTEDSFEFQDVDVDWNQDASNQESMNQDTMNQDFSESEDAAMNAYFQQDLTLANGDITDEISNFNLWDENLIQETIERLNDLTAALNQKDFLYRSHKNINKKALKSLKNLQKHLEGKETT